MISFWHGLLCQFIYNIGTSIYYDKMHGCSIFLVCIWSLLFYVGDAGNTSLVDAGTPLGATAVVTQGVLVIYFGSAAS